MMSCIDEMDIVISAIFQSNTLRHRSLKNEVNYLAELSLQALNSAGLDQLINNNTTPRIGVFMGVNSAEIVQKLSSSLSAETKVSFIASSDADDFMLDTVLNKLLSDKCVWALVGGISGTLPYLPHQQCSRDNLSELGKDMHNLQNEMVILLERRPKNMGLKGGYARIISYQEKLPIESDHIFNHDNFNLAEGLVWPCSSNVEDSHLHVSLSNSPFPTCIALNFKEAAQMDKLLILFNVIGTICSPILEMNSNHPLMECRNKLKILEPEDGNSMKENNNNEPILLSISILNSSQQQTHRILLKPINVRWHLDSYQEKEIHHGNGNCYSTIISHAPELSTQFKSIEKISRTHKMEAKSVLEFLWHEALSIHGKQTLTMVSTMDAGLLLPLPIVVDHIESKSFNVIECAQQLERDRAKLIVTPEFSSSENLDQSVGSFQFFNNAWKDWNCVSMIKHKYPFSIQIFWENDEVHLVCTGFCNEVVDVLKIFKDLIESVTKDPNQKLSDLSTTTPSIGRCQSPRIDRHPISFGQRMLLLHGLLNKISTAYNMSFFYTVTHEIDYRAFSLAINDLIERHVVLKSLYVEDDEGNWWQEEQQNVKVTLRQWHESWVDDIFDLTSEIPFRVYLKKGNDPSEEDKICFLIHHIAFDGLSIPILERELATCYKVRIGHLPDLPNSRIDTQFYDWVLWQRNFLSKKTLANELNFWKNKLEGFEATTLFPDYMRPTHFNYSSGQILPFHFGLELSQELKDLAHSLKVSLFTILLSGYFITLRCFTGEDDLVVGIPITSRYSSLPQAKDLIGFLVNSLPIRVQLNSDTPLAELIHLVRQEIKNAQIHKECPISNIIEALGIQNDQSKHPIFQVMLSYVKYEPNYLEDFMSRSWTQTISPTTARFDLATVMQETQDGALRGYVSYSKILYKKSTVESFFNTFKLILQQLTESKSNTLLVKNLNLRGYQSPPSICDYPLHRTAHEQFEHQVKLFPNACAIITSSIQLTYSELNTRANGVAHILIDQYMIHPGSFVGICFERSEWQIIAMLGVWKSGCAFVPIDPTYPESRINFILTDSNAKVVLTSQEILEKLNNFSFPQICFEPLDGNLRTKSLNSKNLSLAQDSSTDLAYLIYTSGTTGQPKGVLVEHRSLVNLSFSLFDSHYKCAPGSETEFILQILNFVFDGFLEPLVVSILQGQVLIMAPNDLSQLSTLGSILNSVTHLATTPSILLSLDLSEMKSLRRVVLGGEVWSTQVVELLCSIPSQPDIFNSYGLTETTVIATVHSTRELSRMIGTPISNCAVYVLDENLQAVPVGALGEIFIGGIVLSRGYLSRPEITDKKFIDNPFRKGEKFFKTGDIGRWSSDGVLEYVGRKDHQIKLRGHRIELGEVENVISSFENISESVVVLIDNFLVAYFVSTDTHVNIEKLFQYLALKLPNYMVPSHLIQLDGLPLTVSGKVNRNALPPINFSLAAPTDGIPPRNELEEKLCEIWRNVLDIKTTNVSFGIRSDFFELGGDSIVAILLSNQIRRSLGIELEVNDILRYKTIADLHDNVIVPSMDLSTKDKNLQVQVLTEQGRLSGSVELLPIQKWFLYETNYSYPTLNHWNQAFLVKTPKSLDISKLEACVSILVEHHDCFRLRFEKTKLKNGQLEWTQYYNYDAQVEKIKTLNIQGLTENQIELQLTNWQNEFDIENGPVYSVGYLYGYADGSTRVHFAIHHLIVDAISWRILTNDLQMIHNGELLPEKGTSYRQWVVAVDNYSSQNPDEIDYWIEVISDYRLINFPLSDESPDIYTLNFSESETKLFLTGVSKGLNAQVTDVLLTCFAFMLYDVTEKEVNHIIMEGHGRESSICPGIDISNTMGWFTSMYPVRLKIYKNDLVNSIKSIKDILSKIPNRGIGFGPLVGYNGNHIPKFGFNYLGQFESGDEWTMRNENCGKCFHQNLVSPNVIEMNGRVMDGCLSFKVGTKLGRGLAIKLSQRFRDTLLEILALTTKSLTLTIVNDKI